MIYINLQFKKYPPPLNYVRVVGNGDGEMTASLWAAPNFCFLFQLRAQLAYSEFQSRVRTLVDKIEKERVGEPQLWRQLRHLAVIGPAALPADQLDRVSIKDNKGFIFLKTYILQTKNT